MKTIDEQLNALTQFMPVEDLRKRIAAASAWMAGEPEWVIPSTEISTDGIVLKAVFVASGDLISEVRLTDRFDHFDFMKLVVFNIRVMLGMQEVKSGEEVIASYHTATVDLIHSSSRGMGSRISYAGSEPPDQWLNTVKAAFPLNLLGVPS